MNGRLDRVMTKLHRWRDANPSRQRTYRVIIGVIGGAVTILGIVLIPYPGPGWLVVFAGLGILATEFTWARRLLNYAKEKYNRWEAWLGRQSMPIRVLVLTGLFVLVVVVLWIIGVFSLVGGWFGIHASWLRSPVFG